ncbi:MAG TPA: hypothetical protein VFM27_11850 [Acidimicrobiales bacterium]|nr:hypothetical protein [Acidimicrobiales bacterium]
MELPPLPRSTILLVEVGSRGGGRCAVRRGDVGFDEWWAVWERTSQEAAG